MVAPASTFVRKTFPFSSRCANSFDEYNAGLIFRRSFISGLSSEEYSSSSSRPSATMSKSMSLSPRDSPLAMEPKRNASVMRLANAPNAPRISAGMPEVLMTMLRRSSNTGEAALAR